ncbi:MAG: acetolactate synthase large subunit [Geodermatophilaceae bacterium]|nr:acetolactate synthase large subunit [Geodermatophilaceae bacterium]
MNGAEALVRTLAGSGVDVCFANPGTTELHLVDALDRIGSIRAVLCLAEGTVSGAADGYARMAGRPAAALLHLGPGLANGLANLHNARRAYTPVVAVVGDHAVGHQRHDAPLQSDITALVRVLEGWVRRVEAVGDVGAATAEAVAAALGPPGRIATLVVPADVSWSEGATAASAIPPTPSRAVAGERIEEVAGVLRSPEPAVLLIGGSATRGEALRAAERVSAATGARLVCETFPARLERGAGRPVAERLAYLPEQVSAQLAGTRCLVLAGARSPVAFFAYQEQPGDLVPDGCAVHELAGPGADVAAALEALGTLLDAPRVSPAVKPAAAGTLAGELTLASLGAALAQSLPEGAIVSEEAITAGAPLAAATEAAAPHDWLSITGGAIGQGMPVAAGAAIACPDRPVISLQADGSAVYTISALWTQAREGLDVTTVLLSNRSYAILAMELDRLGLGDPGRLTRDLLELSRPDLDFVALARGFGVPGERPETVQEFSAAFRRALAEPGPHLIEVRL